jgi:oligoendopeptidase F
MQLRPAFCAFAWVSIAAAVAMAPACGAAPQPAPAGPPPPALSSAAPIATPAAASAQAPQPSTPPDGNMERSAIPDEFKWKLDVLFAGDEAFEQALKDAASERDKLGAFKGKLGKPKELKQCLDLYFKTRLLTNKLTLYANQRLDSDQKSSKLQGLNDRALSAMNDLMSQASFVRQEVLGAADAVMDKAYKAEPGLTQYRPYLDELRRRRARVVSSDAERILSLAGDNLWAEIDLNEIPSDFEKAFHATMADLSLPKIHDEPGAEVQLTLSNYNKYRTSSDRRVRHDAVEALFGSLRQLQDVFAAEMAGQVRFNLLLARSRGYSTARQAYLDKDNVDTAVYDNLLNTVGANLAPMHRYIRLRKRVMALPDLHIYDLYTPMVRTVPMRFTYDDARRIIPESLAPMGPDYLKILATGMDARNGWLDLYPHKNKKSGAFSSSVFGVHPFVKTNYYEGLDDLSTLAHEFGHAMHSHLAMTNQPYVSSNYAPFIAEIASTFNEKMLSDYLLEHARSDDERLYLLNQMVDRIRTTIYRQTQFAEFEHLIHAAAEKSTPLTAELLNGTYAALVKKYYGPDLTMGPNDEIEWAYVPHFYYKFYVYSYATGLSSGITLARLVKSSGAPARDAYVGMLKGGSSKPPLDLLKGAGVDLTRPDSIVEAAKLMDSMLSEMEKIVEKNGG